MTAFKNNCYFIHLSYLTDTDLIFNITDLLGEQIGTNLTPLSTDLSSKETMILEDKVENLCNKYEIEIRFQQEFNKSLQEIESLGLTRDSIIKQLSKNWLIGSNLLEQHIPMYL